MRSVRHQTYTLLAFTIINTINVRLIRHHSTTVPQYLLSHHLLFAVPSLQLPRVRSCTLSS